MDAFLLPNGYQDDPHKVGPKFMHLERPFTCTCCCLNRPKVVISEMPSGNVIGTLEDPFACCALTTTVTEPGQANPLLMADGSICQPGLCCPCPGNKVDFPVKDTNTGSHIAHLTKVWTVGDCCPFFSKEWSAFDVNFGAAQNPRYKLLITSLAIFIQMAWFDKRNENNS